MLIVSLSDFFFSVPFLHRKTWKPQNMCVGCVWPDSSFIRLTRVACKCFYLAFTMSSLVPVSLSWYTCVSSLLHFCPPLSSERTVTPCLLRASRSPFSLYPFLAFQCSLVPVWLLLWGERCCPPLPDTNASPVLVSLSAGLERSPPLLGGLWLKFVRFLFLCTSS